MTIWNYISFLGVYFPEYAGTHTDTHTLFLVVLVLPSSVSLSPPAEAYILLCFLYLDFSASCWVFSVDNASIVQQIGQALY